MTKVTRSIVSGRHSEVVDKKKKMKPNRQLAEKQGKRGRERRGRKRELALKWTYKTTKLNRNGKLPLARQHLLQHGHIP